MDEPTPSANPRLPNWLAILLLMSLGLGLRLWVIARTEVAARDSIGFIRYALRLEREPFFDVVRTAEQPPGYALAVLAVSWPVRAWTGELSCDTMVLSAQLASALMAVLSIPFMVLLGRELCDKRVGWLSAAIFLSLPAWVRLTSDGLTEGTFLFWLALTLWLGARALRQPGIVRFLLCGIGAGCAFLTRPEGLELVAAAGLVLLGRQLLPELRQRWYTLLPQGVALAMGALLLVGPYVLTTGRLSNKNTIKVMSGDQTANRYGLPISAAPGSRTPLAVWWHESVDEGKSKQWWGLQALATETAHGLHYVGAALALAGLVWFRPRVRGRLGAWLLAVLVAGHAGLLWRMAVTMGYLSERHTLLFVFAACFPAAVALLRLGDRFGDRLRTRALPGNVLITGGLALALLASALPSLSKPLHANRAGHRAAGQWLAQHSTPDDEILDPFNWAHFYSGRLGADAPPTSGRLFVILETSDNQHSRLPAMPDAKHKASCGTVVYHWPDHKPRDTARVLVYEVAKADLQ